MKMSVAMAGGKKTRCRNCLWWAPERHPINDSTFLIGCSNPCSPYHLGVTKPTDQCAWGASRSLVKEVLACPN